MKVKKALAVLFVVILVLLGLNVKKISKLLNLFDTRQKENVEIIHKLENNFETFQEQITLEPVLGAYRWYGPDSVQFISPIRMLISFEDGHMVGIAVVEYDSVSGSFNLLEALSDNDYRYIQDKWSALVKKYGQTDYVPENYTKERRIGESKRYSDWTKVPENLFLK